MSSETVTVAAIQTILTDDTATNIARLDQLVRQAQATQGAQVILMPELFSGHYFCKTETAENFSRAHRVADDPAVRHFSRLAAELSVVLPVSFFERDGPHFYNAVAIVDADGTLLGVYRKSHIPDGPGYEEKFYFRPGNTGFQAFETRFGTIGVGICWDQWFPEAARALMLKGAELLLYPTAIGSEPDDPALNTAQMWQRAMQGHAVSNAVPVIAANRTGTEGTQHFYGASFIADEAGTIIQEIADNQTGVISAEFDLAALRHRRAAFGFFRDRRPELYGDLTSDQ